VDDEIESSCLPLLVTADYLKQLLSNCQTIGRFEADFTFRSHFSHRRRHHAGTGYRSGGDPDGAADTRP
jgi:hypothetical protein